MGGGAPSPVTLPGGYTGAPGRAGGAAGVLPPGVAPGVIEGGGGAGAIRSMAMGPRAADRARACPLRIATGGAPPALGGSRTLPSDGAGQGAIGGGALPTMGGMLTLPPEGAPPDGGGNGVIGPKATVGAVVKSAATMLCPSGVTRTVQCDIPFSCTAFT